MGCLGQGLEIVGEAKSGVCVAGRSLSCGGGGSHVCKTILECFGFHGKDGVRRFKYISTLGR